MNISLKFIDETLAGLNDILRQGGALAPKTKPWRTQFLY
ncbi:phage protein [Streptococcus pyogenes]|nr:phage protein [Streptococcus pyogenes]VHJ10552.1 phage protein [Streptococcus pyogenes]VHJ46125.1 phage protein [Streptococcus pyogenes]